MGERRNRIGFTNKQLGIILDFCRKTFENPKIPYNKFHREYKPYSRKQSTIDLLNKAYKRKAMIGPFIYSNIGINVNLIDSDKKSLEIYKKRKNNPNTTLAIALSGDWSFIWFKKGASTLQYTSTPTPSYPQNIRIEDLYFEEEGILPRDPYPSGWDDLDFAIYDLFGSPRDLSFTEAARELEISWKTVRLRLTKVLKQSKVLSSFFPLGFPNYQPILLTFKTKFEVGLELALKKLDRTSYIYKSDNTIILIFFSLPGPWEYNKTTKRFKELEEIGIIHDLRVSIPLEYYSIF